MAQINASLQNPLELPHHFLPLFLQGELLSPCRCDGSVKCTHQPCLIKWISERGCWSCELCYYKYHVIAISTKNPLQVQPRCFLLWGFLDHCFSAASLQVTFRASWRRQMAVCGMQAGGDERTFKMFSYGSASRGRDGTKTEKDTEGRSGAGPGGDADPDGLQSTLPVTRDR